MKKRERVNITDKNGTPVYVGDEFLAYIIEPSPYPPTKVIVVKDVSTENIELWKESYYSRK
jgi:hypothetical protein